jgi:hypothetical protein
MTSQNIAPIGHQKNRFVDAWDAWPSMGSRAAEYIATIAAATDTTPAELMTESRCRTARQIEQRR